MAWRLKEFDCPKCGITEKLVESTVSQVICCGKTAKSVLCAPKLIGMTGLTGDEGRFNPHYDLSLGQYFGSLEEKKHYLKSTDRVEDGTSSPRKTNKSRIICSRTQAKVFKDPKRAAPLVKNL